MSEAIAVAPAKPLSVSSRRKVGGNVRIGIVGAGRLSTSRVHTCLPVLPIEYVAICDLDREKAEANARRFGAASVYTDFDTMLSDASLDAVIICVGPEQHAAMAIKAMAAGLAVYTEKPPAVTADDARTVLEASLGHRQICMTGFKKRFAPAYRKAKAAMDDERFGARSLLSIDYCSGPFYQNRPGDPRDEFLLDFCIHILDLSRFLFGEVAEVHTRAPNGLTYAVSLQFRNGAVGVLAMSGNRDRDVATEKVELTGGPGEFISLNNSVQMTQHRGRSIADWHDPVFSTARGDSLVETGFAGELAEFINAVQLGRDPESSISSAHRTMVLYEAVRESARSGHAVDIADLGGDRS